MKLLMFSLLLLFPLVAEAQVPKAVWEQPGITGGTFQAQSFIYKIYVTQVGQTTPSLTQILTPVTCIPLAATSVECSAPLGLAGTAATTSGAKSELTAKDGTSAESLKSIPFIFPVTVVPASVPGNLRITR